MARLAVIGAGMMGEALVRGLLTAGWEPAEVAVADVRRERLEALRDELCVEVSGDNTAVAKGAEAVLLAVKPQDVPSVLDGLRDMTGAVLSIAAGVRTATIEDRLGGSPAVVRAMPNTPARVGLGVTALAPGRNATDASRKLAEEVFSAVGPVVWVTEPHLDAVTALSGSGPAYVFLVAEAMVEAGVTLGLPREVAETLTYATIEGSGRMLSELREHPAVLRAQVTSPGGTTAAALGVLEARAVRAAFGEALRAAKRRSEELA